MAIPKKVPTLMPAFAVVLRPEDCVSTAEIVGIVLRPKDCVLTVALRVGVAEIVDVVRSPKLVGLLVFRVSCRVSIFVMRASMGSLS
jgi:hypothetical protein